MWVVWDSRERRRGFFGRSVGLLRGLPGLVGVSGRIWSV